MLKIGISDQLRDKVPGIVLYCIECDVVPEDSPAQLRELLNEECEGIKNLLKLEEICSLPAIRASRNAYKAAGKDPARYRLSAEALLRRVVKGEELYRIGNVVDLLNLASISSGFSIGGYDADKIEGDICFGIGAPDEPYAAIGRGTLNIEGLPVFRDSSGAFGSPTSDSERTSVTASTRRFLMVIIDFGARHLLDKAGEMAINLLNRFAYAKNMEINLVK